MAVDIFICYYYKEGAAHRNGQVGVEESQQLLSIFIHLRKKIDEKNKRRRRRKKNETISLGQKPNRLCFGTQGKSAPVMCAFALFFFFFFLCSAHGTHRQDGGRVISGSSR
jgi:hypothetical protein